MSQKAKPLLCNDLHDCSIMHVILYCTVSYSNYNMYILVVYYFIHPRRLETAQAIADNLIMAKQKTSKRPNPPLAAEPNTEPLSNPRQERLCQEYANPDSPGHGNKTKAAELAGYNPSHAREYLRHNPTLLNRVAGIYEEIGIGHKVRGRKLQEIINGTYEHKSTITVKGVGPGGQPITSTRVSKRNPTANEVSKAIDITNRSDGTYQQQQAAADAIGSELRAVFKAQRKDLKGMNK